MEVVAGVDAGATSTKSVIIDLSGKILGQHIGPAANPFIVGHESAAKIIMDTIRRASCGICKLDEVKFIACGVTGVETPRCSEELRRIIKKYGVLNATVVHDSLIVLEGALAGRPGIVVYSGTGSFAIGRNAFNEIYRVGGMGFFLSDEGSGFYLGHQALRAAIKGMDGRGEKTLLTNLILKHFKINRFEQLEFKLGLRSKPVNTSEIAALAPLVLKAAKEKDVVAVRIVQSAVDELLTMVKAVAYRLSMANTAFLIATSGGVFKSSLIRRCFVRRVYQEFPDVRVIKGRFPPVIGAAILALRSLNIPVTKRILSNIRSSAACTKLQEG